MVASAVRLAVAGRRREGRLLELLGATGSFRRGPALVHGLVTGLIGGLLACAALAIAYGRLADPVAAAIGAALGPSSLDFLPPVDLVALVAVGAGLGAIGGLFATRWDAARA